MLRLSSKIETDINSLETIPKPRGHYIGNLKKKIFFMKRGEPSTPPLYSVTVVYKILIVYLFLKMLDFFFLFFQTDFFQHYFLSIN